MLVLLFISMLAEAESIKGRVVEKVGDKKVGLPGANVYWDGTTQGVVTDEDGYFKIKWNDCKRLVASFIGYKTAVIEIVDRNRNVEILMSSGEMLDEVKVMTRGNTTIMSTRGPVIGQVINGEELKKAACCNLGESFTTNASVDVAYTDAVTGAKQIQLLGLTGRYVQMMTEGLPNYRGISSLYGLNYVPGPWMSAISVSKGASSVLNGYEAIAGQISVDYKKPRTCEKVYFNAIGNDSRMFELNADAGILLTDKLSTAFLVHMDRMDVEHDGNHDGFLDMPTTRQYNIMHRWEYKSDTWMLQFGGKFLDEKRIGGQKGFHKSMRGQYGEGNLYGIGIDSRRYEVFAKIGYLMPQYPNTSMALMVNYTDHDHDAYYGAKNYDAHQKSVFVDYVYQSIFGNNPDQEYSAGFSFNFDRYEEQFNDFIIDGQRCTETADMTRPERVGGAFFQYTGGFWDKLTLMAGLRYDRHSKFGNLWTPRLHILYKPDEMTSLKLSAGSGARTANILADNTYLLASSNNICVDNKLLASHPDMVDQLKMEKAWNFGVQLNRKFAIFGRMMNINLDYYRTDFKNQVIVDNESQTGIINFYNLEGDSYSNSYQIELKYELIPRLDVLLAYRYNDTKSTIGGEKKRSALQTRYKGLVNLSYYTNMKKWQFDFTTQFNGGGRIPLNPSQIAAGMDDTFSSFHIMNLQVSKFFRRWSIYAGCENIADYMQHHPIIGADKVWTQDFDSSKIWGPVHGRKMYLGFRFALERI